MFVALWSVLIVGTLVGAFFLFRDLYRRGKRLLAELERATEVFEALDPDREVPVTTPVPVDFDLAVARARRAEAAEVTARRRARREERRRATRERWRELFR